MALKCVLCGMCHLPAERCGSDTVAGLDRSERMDRARAALGEASAKVGLPPVPARPPAPPPTIAKQPPESAASPGKFDRAAYQRAYMKAYMKTYMQAYRARQRLKPPSP
jgi:hypothetical protein